MLGVFGEKQRIRIRKQKNPMIHMNRAGFAPRVAHQARVPHWVYIARAHALTGVEARRHRYIPCSCARARSGVTAAPAAVIAAVRNSRRVVVLRLTFYKLQSRV